MTEEKSKACPLCDGTGKIYVDDLNVRQCRCAYQRALALHLKTLLGPDVVLAPAVHTTPLYAIGPDGQPTVDKTTENLLLKGWWSDLCGHFRWALGCKGPLYPFTVVTDERIRTVFVGGESYSTKSRKIRDEVASVNTLHDLLGSTYPLVIIRLGFLGYKNVAMPGALLESLRIREASQLPTWIVEEPNSLFGPGHFAYNDEVFNYIHHHYKVMDLTSDTQREIIPRGVEVVGLDDDDLAMGSDPVVERQREQARQKKAVVVTSRFEPASTPPPRPVRQETSFDLDPILMGNGAKKRTKHFSRGED